MGWNEGGRIEYAGFDCTVLRRSDKAALIMVQIPYLSADGETVEKRIEEWIPFATMSDRTEQEVAHIKLFPHETRLLIARWKLKQLMKQWRDVCS